MGIPFVPFAEPVYGEAVRLSDLVTRVVARNPSRFTFHGTGTYLVGREEVAIIDPGPALAEHHDALDAAVAGRRVSAIVVTHTHTDHCALAAAAEERFGAPVVGCAAPRAAHEDWPNDEWPHFALPPEVEAELRAEVERTGAMMEEGTDTGFAPGLVLGDGDVAAVGEGWSLTAVHTPGHTSNHLCYRLDAETDRGASDAGHTLFTGDHVMSWSTTVVAPPDGDMTAYLDSLERLVALRPAVLLPTHGAPVTEPGPFLTAYLEHRHERERQILGAVDAGVDTLAEMVPKLYAAVHPALFPAAARSVFAHLLRLAEDGTVAVADGHVRPLATFTRAR